MPKRQEMEENFFGTEKLKNVTLSRDSEEFFWSKKGLFDNSAGSPYSGGMFDSIPTLIDELRAGRMIVVVDDPSRENEGDLVLAAQAATPEAVNFMITHGRGLVCMPLAPEWAAHLGLKPMVLHNQSTQNTPFTQSIGARVGITTGISAHDRARTIQVAASTRSEPGDIVCPGHVFPLIAHARGVLGRAGHTEAATDLVALAGFSPVVGVICEILDTDGQPARLPQLRLFAQEYGLKLGSVSDLIAWRKVVEPGGIEPPTS